MYHFLQCHSLLRFSVCFFMAFLCCFAFIAPPIVTAHAFAITSAFVLVAGTILASLGVTFATNTELQKGAATFYNSLATGAANVKTFIDEQVKKVTAGTAAVMTIPTACFIQAKQAVATTFPKAGTVVEDTSGVVSIPWRKDVGKTLVNIDKFPISVVVNQLPAYSPNAGTPFIPIKLSQVSPFNTSWFSDKTNDVLRIVGLSGKTYDYKIHVVVTADNVILELSENGNYVFGLIQPYVGVFSSVQFDRDLMRNGSLDNPFCGLYTSFWLSSISAQEQMLYDNCTVVFDASNSLFHASAQSVFSGLCDGRTGVVALPQVGYAPDQTLVGQDVWNGALDDVIAKNPSFSGVDVSIPAAEADLINAKWDKVVTAQMDLIKALTDRIAALENTGGGAGTVTGSVEITMGDIKLPDLAAPAAITTLFPFCIPFDIARGIEALKAPPVEPHFEVPFKYGDIINETIVLDLSWLDFVIRFIRWAELFLFSLGLARVTRDFIKW